METKEIFLPPTSLQRLADSTLQITCQSVLFNSLNIWKGAGRERMVISWGKSVKCLPALRHKYNSVKYKDSATGDRPLSSRRLQQPQHPPIHQHSWALRTQQMSPLRCREMSESIYPVTRRHVSEERVPHFVCYEFHSSKPCHLPLSVLLSRVYS